MKNNTFGLSQQDWDYILSELVAPLKAKGAEVWIFGSRATLQHHKYSDLDILFETKAPLPLHFIFELKDKMEESNLPIKIDLVDRSHLAEDYKQNIEKQKIPL